MVSTYLNLKKEVNNDGVYKLLFNPKYNDNDNPLQLFKNICAYVREEKKLLIKESSKNNKYLDDFNIIFNKAIKQKLEKKIWVDLINQKAKYFLYYDLFYEEENEAIKYVFTLKNKSEDFFWNIVDREDIIGNVAC